MACARCQERREVIKDAVKAKTVTEAVNAARFLVTTATEDAGRALIRAVKRK